MKGYKTLVEVKERDDDDDRRQRLDILIRNCNSPSYGYELVVAPSLRQFREHVSRAGHYAEIHETDNMFVVNLCPKPHVDYFDETLPTPEMLETPEMNMDQFEEMTSVRRSSRLADRIQSNYAESLRQPQEPFVFPVNVTVVNVTIREENERLVANLVYRDGEENTVIIKGSKWYI